LSPFATYKYHLGAWRRKQQQKQRQQRQQQQQQQHQYKQGIWSRLILLFCPGFKTEAYKAEAKKVTLLPRLKTETYSTATASVL